MVFFVTTPEGLWKHVNLAFFSLGLCQDCPCPPRPRLPEFSAPTQSLWTLRHPLLESSKHSPIHSYFTNRISRHGDLREASYCRQNFLFFHYIGSLCSDHSHRGSSSAQRSLHCTVSEWCSTSWQHSFLIHVL